LTVVDMCKARTGVSIAALIAALASIAAVCAPQAGAAQSFVQAHRGGTLETIGGVQKPVRPEETLATFRHAAKAGYVVELDVKLTADRVPVVLHDASLERTTDCDGNVGDITAAELRAQCEVDLLGTTDNDRPMKAGDPRRAPVPQLGQVLRMAKHNKAWLNLEIKNQPGEPDFDGGPAPAYAKKIAKKIQRSGFPPRKLIVQSFWPANLSVIEDDPYFDRTATSFLSLSAGNSGAPAIAESIGAEYVSPGWPVTPQYVDDAHGMGLGVLPYTIDVAADLRDAEAAGVDGVITNDPKLARRIHKGG
jgi:glycerophosphoryl diester phosphodiesterase